ncbi:FAD-dependent oxidoreductase [Microvirga splendida]|uniref:FAD-dependent oxidoreductase n=1 Tax=Microvirga splendida TaxID=2795727 RepID=A0ABS0Y739_9HYPH|nr:FAD-dependent oxidoreductase [Microvirga splendida]MBJ6128124.1 FAD-dependent oxidoreductase [Microvirga splendida]
MADLEFVETFDVVVVGSGAGGMAAALTARDAGLTVLVVEKTEFFGGSTAVSGGAVWIPDNPHMAEVGHSDSRDAVITYLSQTVGNRMRREIVDAYLDNGPRMVRFLEERTAVRFTARAYSPDYKPELGGASFGGRTLDPVEFDGRRLGPLFKHLRPPIRNFLVFGGMMVGRSDINALLGLTKSVANVRHGAAILSRYARDKVGPWGRGTRLLLGNALAGMLLKSADDAGVVLRRNVPVQRLIMRGGHVIGVAVGTPSGERAIEARLGVVLATGGFPHSAARRLVELPTPDVHRSVVPKGNTGDGLDLALSAGAALEDDNAGPALWAPVSVWRRADGSESLFPHLVTDRQKPGLIAVNSTGRRFTNEASSYHDFVAGMLKAEGESPSVPAYLICDRTFLKRYGLGLVRPGIAGAPLVRRLVRDGYLFEAQAIPDLASKIGVPAAALEQTVASMNRAARTGEDPDFGRGASAYDRYLGDPEHSPNPCLGAIERPPFYAVAVWPGDIGTAKGLRADASARVLDTEGRPIPGLYVAGNDMNSVMAGTYPAAGITLGPALTFGYIAGQAIATSRT